MLVIPTCFWHTDLYCFTKHSFCHTERSEVSKNSLHCHTEALAEVSITLKRVLNSLDFSLSLKNDNDLRFLFLSESLK